MTKKKTRRSQVKQRRKLTPLPTSFDCPECSAEGTVKIKIVQKKKGCAYCTVCEAKYVMNVDRLSAGVDVYTKWLDEKSKQ